MRTIGDLNGKIWYRFLKVVLILFCLALMLLANWAFIANGASIKGIDNNKTEINCNYWGKISFTPASIGVDMSYADYLNYSSGGVDDGTYQTIVAKCYGNPDNVYDWRNTGVPTGTPIFDIRPVYVYNYAEFFGSLIIGNALALLILETLRRLFYYVVLGSWRPRR
jgi:hypothetical protein